MCGCLRLARKHERRETLCPAMWRRGRGGRRSGLPHETIVVGFRLGRDLVVHVEAAAFVTDVAYLARAGELVILFLKYVVPASTPAAELRDCSVIAG